jgi:hypothetical protein
LAQLGIRHIAAYSPEARGRSERAFRTLQDRLPKELALPGIVTIEAANRWIAESCLPAHNAAFAVAPEHAGTAVVPDHTAAARRSCASRKSAGSATTTLKLRGLPLQIPSSPLRAHFVPISCARWRACTSIPGQLAIFPGPHRLAE